MAAIREKPARKQPVSKRTSIGLQDRPKNKHSRKNWKAYRGQGRPK
jgi:hypothetical protein